LVDGRQGSGSGVDVSDERRVWVVGNVDAEVDSGRSAGRGSGAAFNDLKSRGGWLHPAAVSRESCARITRCTVVKERRVKI